VQRVEVTGKGGEPLKLGPAPSEIAEAVALALGKKARKK